MSKMQHKCTSFPHVLLNVQLLNQALVEAQSVNGFKRHLDILHTKKMDYVMDSWSLLAANFDT